MNKTPAIFMRLHGGLGNQLFQYAVGRALALRNEAALVLDARAYTQENPFRYDLGHFNIQAEIGAAGGLPPDKTSPLRYAFWRKFGRNPRFVRERGLGYNAGIAELGPGNYLHGYFQSERYFRDVKTTIRADLTFVSPPSAENSRMAEKIGKTHAVSLHVRRGDYIGNAKARLTHGAPAMSYYRKAIERLQDARNAEITAFIFSDDPAWALENIKPDCASVVVSINDGRTAHEDLRLMAACRDHVIANSTFSWWGAWLNPSPAKTVIAPMKWYASSKLDNPDILPAGWIRLGD